MNNRDAALGSAIAMSTMIILAAVIVVALAFGIASVLSDSTTAPSQVPANANVAPVQIEGNVSLIGSEVKNGNTIFHFMLSGDKHVFTANSSINSELSLVREGHKVKLEASISKGDNKSLEVSKFNDITLFPVDQ